MKLFGSRKKKAENSDENAKPRTKKKWLHMPRWVVVCLCVLLLLFGGYMYVTQALIVPPPIPPTPTPDSSPTLPVENVTPSGEPQQTASPSPEGESDPGLFLDIGRKEGVYTIILAGTDFGDYRTDSLMVATLDVKNHTLKVLGIPRDTQVNVKRSSKKINAAWGVGGIDELKKELKTVIGFEPESYAVVDLKGFVRLVDAVDGVDFDVPQRMRKTDTSQNLYIRLDKGPQHLDGEHAIQLVRFRDYEMGDIQRMKVQQDFLKAVAKQTLQLGNVFKIGEFADIAHDHLRSNLTVGQMIWFGQEVMKLQEEDISFYSLPVDIGAKYHKEDYALVREQEALTLINETINPCLRDRTADDLDIIRLKGN